MSAKSCTFEMLIIKALHNLLMCKDTTLFPEFSKEKDFSFEKTSCGKKIRIDFNAPDLSSNGGLILFQGMDCGLLDKILIAYPIGVCLSSFITRFATWFVSVWGRLPAATRMPMTATPSDTTAP